jgi:hypothetical protein
MNGIKGLPAKDFQTRLPGQDCQDREANRTDEIR